MSVCENVAKQVCAIDHFIGKYSFLLINQFIKRENFFNLRKYPSSAVAARWQRVHARTSFVQYIAFFLVRYVDDQTFTQ